MARHRILLHIFPYFIIIVFGVLIALAWYTTSIIKDFHIDQVRRELEFGAGFVESQLRDEIISGDEESVRKFCREFGGFSPRRITVVDSSGKVLGDSEEDPARMERHSDREEISEAISGIAGSSIRYSYTLQKFMMYVAVPVRTPAGIAAVVRLSMPVDSIESRLWRVDIKLLVFGLVILAAAAVASILVSKRISAPVEDLKTVAQAYSRGDFSIRPPLSKIEEIDGLSRSLKDMSEEIGRKLAEITAERNRREAILASMQEGVIAVDSADTVILMNRAATSLLNVSSSPYGRLYHEVVRNKDIQDFIAEVVVSSRTVEKDIEMIEDDRRSMNLRGTALSDSAGSRIGALVVLNDITRIRRLEKIRSEFITNVSHELKTPLTAISAAVETILDGDFKIDKDLGKLLKIIEKHTDRLTALADDTLTLAELESKPEGDDYKFEDVAVDEVVAAAADFCREKADSRGISIRVACVTGLRAKMSRVLIEQSLVNLIDNAVKYSDEGKSVEVRTSEMEQCIVFSVIDSGCGIPKEDLPRIFERFYTVDKARSRKMGGTGLGLSIVKHIAGIHGGRVTVESEPGKGSAFHLWIPV